MSSQKTTSRRIARKRFWQEHDRETYECPDCDRTEDELEGSLEVHHKDGSPYDNRLENLVGLCRLCHNIREGKKPPLSEIESLRQQTGEESGPEIPYAVRAFLSERAREPFDGAYVDVLGVWQHFFESFCDDSEVFDADDVTVNDLLNGLEQIAGATIEENNGCIEVWGVEPK